MGLLLGFLGGGGEGGGYGVLEIECRTLHMLYVSACSISELHFSLSWNSLETFNSLFKKRKTHTFLIFKGRNN